MGLNDLQAKAKWVRENGQHARYFCGVDECDQREEARIAHPGGPRTIPAWFYKKSSARAHMIIKVHPVFRMRDLQPI